MSKGMTFWGYEAKCPRCGEFYIPHSLRADEVQHWCDDEQFGGEPREVWEIYMRDMVSKKIRSPKTKLVRWKANVAAAILVSTLMAGLVWMAIGLG